MTARANDNSNVNDEEVPQQIPTSTSPHPLSVSHLGTNQAAIEWLRTQFVQLLNTENVIQKIDIQVSTIVNSIARIWGIPASITCLILDYVANKASASITNIVLLKLCETVQHAVTRHAQGENLDNNMTYADIALCTLKTCLQADDNRCKSVLAQSLAYILPQSGDTVMSRVRSVFKNLQGIDTNVKSQILNQLRKNDGRFQNLTQDLVGKGVDVACLTLTQTQTVSTYTNLRKEKDGFKVLNIFEALKSQQVVHGRSLASKQLDNTPNRIFTKSGSFVSRWWELAGKNWNVDNIHQLIKKGEIIPDNDLNNYLHNKFFGKHNYIHAHALRTITNYLSVNVKIAEIFSISSSKQRLSDEVLNKFFTHIEEAFSSQQLKNITLGFFIQAVSQARFLRLSHDQLHQINFYILDAVYNQCLLVGVQSVLSEERQGIIKTFLKKCKDDKGNNNAFYEKGRLKGLDILTLCEQTTSDRILDAEHRLQTMEKLVSGSPEIEKLTLLEESIAALIAIAKGSETQHFFTDENNQQRIFSLINSCCGKEVPTFQQRVGLGAVDIVQNFMSNCTASFVKDSHIKNIIENLSTDGRIVSCNEVFVSKFLCLVMLSTQQQFHSQDSRSTAQDYINSIIIDLINLIGLRDSNISNLVLAVVTQIVQEQSNFPIKFFITDDLMKKLSDENKLDFSLMSPNGQPDAIDSRRNDEHSYTASTYAAYLIYKSINSAINLQDEDSTLSSKLFDYLKSPSANANARTRIYVAETLFDIHRQQKIHHQQDCCFCKDGIQVLQDLTYDELPDVSLFLIPIYIQCCLKLPSSELNEDIVSVISHFSPEGLFPEDQKLSMNLNEGILQILKNLALIGFPLDDTCFMIFKGILSGEVDDNSTPLLVKVVAILTTLAEHSNPIPEAVIAALENVKDFPHVMTIIEFCIEKFDTAIPSAMLDHLAIELFESNNEDRRIKVTKSLKLADSKFNLSEITFYSLKMEEALNTADYEELKLKPQEILKRLTFLQSCAEKLRQLTPSNFICIKSLLSQTKQDDNVLKRCLDLLLIARNHSILDESWSSIIENLLQIDVEVNFEVLRSICNLIRRLLNKKSTILSKNSTSLQKKLESMMIKVSEGQSRNPELFVAIAWTCFDITRQDTPNHQIFNLSCSELIIDQVGKSSEICLLELISLVAEIVPCILLDYQETLLKASNLFLNILHENQLPSVAASCLHGINQILIQDPTLITAKEIERIISVGENTESNKIKKIVKFFFEQSIWAVILTSDQTIRIKAIAVGELSPNQCLVQLRKEIGSDSPNLETLKKLMRFIAKLINHENEDCSEICRYNCWTSVCIAQLRLAMDLAKIQMENVVNEEVLSSLLSSLNRKCGIAGLDSVIFILTKCRRNMRLTMTNVIMLCELATYTIVSQFLQQIVNDEEANAFQSPECRQQLKTSLQFKTTSNDDSNLEELINCLMVDTRYQCSVEECKCLVIGANSTGEFEEMTNYAWILGILIERGQLDIFRNETRQLMQPFAGFIQKFVELGKNYKNFESMLNRSTFAGFVHAIKYLILEGFEERFEIYHDLIKTMSDNVAAVEFVTRCVQCFNKEQETVWKSLIEVGTPHLIRGMNSKNRLIRHTSYTGLAYILDISDEFFSASNAHNKWIKECQKRYPKITTLTSETLQKLTLIQFSKPQESLLGMLKVELFVSTMKNEPELKQFIFAKQLEGINDQGRLTESILEMFIVGLEKGQIQKYELYRILSAMRQIGQEKTADILRTSFLPGDKICKTAINLVIESKSHLNQNETSEEQKMLENTVVHALSCTGNFSQLLELIQSITRIEDFNDFKHLLQFLQKYPDHLAKFQRTRDFNSPKDMLVDFQSMELIILMAKPKTIGKDFEKSKTNFLSLLQKSYEFESLANLIRKASMSVSIGLSQEAIVPVLQIMNQFKIDKHYQTEEVVSGVMRIMNDKIPKNWVKECNQLLFQNLFYSTDSESTLSSTFSPRPTSSLGEKSLQKIIHDFVTTESDVVKTVVGQLGFSSEDIQTEESLTIKLVSFIERVTTIKEVSGIDFAPKENIEVWTKAEFNLFATGIKKRFKRKRDQCPEFLSQLLGVIMQANCKVSKHKLTHTQILSVVIALFRKSAKGNGLLQQINTGGGKSIIIRLVAAFQVLKGKKVFVATSNGVLAERDAKGAKLLFDLLGISVDHNGDKRTYISGKKGCYNNNVIYGEAPQFMFDTLRDEFSGLDTLGENAKDFTKIVMIVDEVDAMFIDESSKYTRLSSEIPGLDLFSLIFIFVWNKLMTMQSKIFPVRDLSSGDMIQTKSFLALGNLIKNPEKDVYDLEYLDKTWSQKEVVSDIQSFISMNYFELEKYEEIAIEIKEDLRSFVQKHLEKCLRAFVTDETIDGYEMDLNQKMKIPKNLRSFVHSQIPIWAKNALRAHHDYHDRIHYIVEDGRILPVDFHTNGMVREEQQWGNGLHQFLQIKHKLALTQETLATNFLSTFGFFNRFGKCNLFGFTGTFGSDAEIKFTKDVYNVDLTIIPRSHDKKYAEFEDIVVQTEGQWLESIVDSVSLEVLKGRAVLVVCRTIMEAEGVHGALQTRYPYAKLYTRNAKYEERRIERARQGDVIVATNLAGRGTDIKAEEVDKFGGLHVCMTFVPSSKRAEDQVLGRTSRLWHVGTAQFILLSNNSVKYNTNSLEDLRKNRDKIEKDVLTKFQNHSLPTMILKDNLMQRMCKLLSNLREKLKKDNLFEGRYSFGKKQPSVYERRAISAVEERWAFLIRNIETVLEKDSGENQSKLEEIKYKQFEYEIVQAINSKNNNAILNIIKSPFHAIAIGNEWVKAGYEDEAYQSFKLAEKLDENFCTAAHIGKAWCYTNNEHSFPLFRKNSKKKTVDHKNKIITEACRAMELLSIEGSQLSTAFLTHLATLKYSVEENGDIDALSYGENMTNHYVQDDLAKQIHQKMTILQNYSSSLEQIIDATKRSQRRIDLSYGVNQTLKINYKSIERSTAVKIINKKMHDITDKDVNITFHDLSVRDDVKNRDQAKELIDFASKVEAEWIPIPQDNFRLTLRSITSDKLLEFLQEYKTITLSSAQFKEKLYITDEEGLWKSAAIKIAGKFNSGEEIVKCQVFDRDGKKVEEILREECTRRSLVQKFENHPKTHTYHVFTDNRNVQAQLGEAEYEMTLQDFDVINCKNLEGILNNLVKLSLYGEEESLEQFFNDVISTNFSRTRTFLSYKLNKKDNMDYSMVVKEIKNGDKLNKKGLIKMEIIINIGNKLWRTVFQEAANSDLLSFDLGLQKLKINEIFNILQFHKKAFDVHIIPNDMASMVGIIDTFRNGKFPIAVTVLKLTNAKATKLLEYTKDQEMQKIKKQHVKKLSLLYSAGQEPPEIWPLMSRGMEYLLQFCEEEFIPRWSIGTVCLLGVLQISVGTFIILNGFSAPLGMAFMSEGVVDLITGYRAYSSRQFSWKRYGVQKSLSLAISAVSVGIGTTSVLNEAGEQTLVRAVENPKTVLSAGQQCLLNLKSLLLPQVGVLATETLVRECLYEASEAMSDFIVDNMEDYIANSVDHHLILAISQTGVKKLLTTLQLLHSNQSKLFLDVDRFTEEIVNSQNSDLKRQLATACTSLSQGVTAGAMRPAILLGTTLGTMMYGSVEIARLVSIFCQLLERKLKNYEKSYFTLTKVISQECNLDGGCFDNQMPNSADFAASIRHNLTSSAADTPELITFCDFVDQQRFIDAIDKATAPNLELVNVETAKRKLIRFVKDFNLKFNTNLNSPFAVKHSEISRLLLDAIVNQMSKVGKEFLIKPASSVTINKLVASASTFVQSRFLVNTKNHSTKEKENHEKYEELLRASLDGKELNTQENEFMLQYQDSMKQMTIAQQKSDNAAELKTFQHQARSGGGGGSEVKSARPTSATSAFKTVRKWSSRIQTGVGFFNLMSSSRRQTSDEFSGPSMMRYYEAMNQQQNKNNRIYCFAIIMVLLLIWVYYVNASLLPYSSEEYGNKNQLTKDFG